MEKRRQLMDLSLHIAPGEIYGFIGHNGAGKDDNAQIRDRDSAFVPEKLRSEEGRSVRTDWL